MKFLNRVFVCVCVCVFVRAWVGGCVCVCACMLLLGCVCAFITKQPKLPKIVHIPSLHRHRLKLHLSNLFDMACIISWRFILNVLWNAMHLAQKVDH